MKAWVRLGVLLLLPLGAGAAPAQRPTESFRAEHADIQERLDRLDAMLDSLEAAPPARQQRVMQEVVGFLEEEIAPHAKWEEEVLYPLVDRQAGMTEPPFSATMRYEHRLIEQRMGQLSSLASQRAPDAGAFAEQAERLLGIIDAHF
ncbi:MAG TPA: hemerythrin domain-containing protein, partial [Myxococcaceae bacterium]|nr:hemerythrin domain-containing protein [Myxococcaceae bacterium]